RPAQLILFPADDGIRALYVTGVQACALPISAPYAPTRRRARGAGRPARRVLGRVGAYRAARARAGARAGVRRPRARRDRVAEWRSEERRVGKEGITGWARQCGGA